MGVAEIELGIDFPSESTSLTDTKFATILSVSRCICYRQLYDDSVDRLIGTNLLVFSLHQLADFMHFASAPNIGAYSL